MPRKKTEMIEQPIRLSPNVTVLITAPAGEWPVIQWNGGRVTVAVQGSEAPDVPSLFGHVTPGLSGMDNMLPKDAPEIVAARLALEARHTANQSNPVSPVSLGLPSLAELGVSIGGGGIPAGAVSNEDVE